jgi:hypothetical protein
MMSNPYCNYATYAAPERVIVTSVHPSNASTKRLHLATLLNLLRSGEQSAVVAFSRILRRLSRGERSLALPELALIIDDETRHDQILADHAATLPAVTVDDSQTRRFFRSLETRDSKVHLARVAALDSCVCQVLTRTLARAPVEPLKGSLVALLSGIRADEARHVRTSRALARVLGADTQLLRVINLEIRQGFATLLATRAPSFEALGVDSELLLATIRHGH